jgi:hypothetical protein
LLLFNSNEDGTETIYFIDTSQRAARPDSYCGSALPWMEAEAMTQAQWFSSTDPHEMLAFLKEMRPKGLLSWLGLRKSKVSERKLQLFACACCRRIWPLLADDRSRQAIETTELYADGLASRSTFHKGVQAARAASLQSVRPRVMMGEWLAAAQARAAEAVACTLEADDPADEAATWGKEAVRAWAAQSQATNIGDPLHMPWLPYQAMSPEAAWIAEGIAQCELLRDLVANPFQPLALHPSWRSGPAVDLAKTIIQDHAYSAVAELAGVLEKAGCDNPDILRHCRETKDHARGCWALDFVLGRE